MSSSTTYMLDTNTVSYLANGRSPAAREALRSLPPGSTVAISAITEAEVLFGLERKPEATRLRREVELVLARIDVLPWRSPEARAYARLRAEMATSGKALSLMDSLIAAHAVATDSVLVTSDKAFAHIDSLRTVNWAADI